MRLSYDGRRMISDDDCQTCASTTPLLQGDGSIRDGEGLKQFEMPIVLTGGGSVSS